MKRLSRGLLGVCLALAGGWAHAAPTSDLLKALDRGLRPTVLPAGLPADRAAPGWSLAERMAHHKIPGVAIAVIRDGKVVQAVGYGVREAGKPDKVDADTLFSVGSISKVATATTTMRLASQGKVDLDRNVDGYLKRWKLPASTLVPSPDVSLRMLLSHTAGLGVHGFADYQPSEPLPTLVQVLDGQTPAKNEAVRFKTPPGAVSDYSGGGITVEQAVIEDATGQSLAQLAKAEVFAPLGMARSTYEGPAVGAANIAHAHGGDGAPRALPRGWESFAEPGASGLWTSASDLGRLVGALIRSYQGRSDFLPQPLASAMMTEVSPGPFGLGPRLAGAGLERRFFHLGANESYLAFLEGYLETGDGYVILTNGANGLALIAEIRNALSDAIGQGGSPPVRTVALRAPPSPDYAGRYRLDPATPIEVRRALADSFEYDLLRVDVAGDAIGLATSADGKAAPLLPLGPSQFAQSGIYVFDFEFRRDARGRVRGLAVSMPETGSVAYYARD
ncbi:serine hydrolase domain-containing protein [Caulobacter segnis]